MDGAQTAFDSQYPYGFEIDMMKVRFLLDLPNFLPYLTLGSALWSQ